MNTRTAPTTTTDEQAITELLATTCAECGGDLPEWVAKRRLHGNMGPNEQARCSHCRAAQRPVQGSLASYGFVTAPSADEDR